MRNYVKQLPARVVTLFFTIAFAASALVGKPGGGGLDAEIIDFSRSSGASGVPVLVRGRRWLI